MVHWVVQILKIVTVVVLSALVLIGGTRAFEYYRDQNIPDDVGKTYTISISENDDEDEVAEKLTEAGLVQNDVYFKTRLRVENKSIEPGTYRLVKGLSTAEIIGLITTEESSARSESNPDITFTVIEGWRTEQIADELDNLGYNWGSEAFLTNALSAPLARTAWLAVVGVAVAPLLLFMPRVVEPAANWLYARIAGNASADGPTVFFDALRKQMGRALIVPLGVTVAAFLINYLQAWLVAHALGMTLSFVDVFAVVSISSLLGLLPISVSGVGVREAFFALIFPIAFGLTETMGIAFGLGVFGVIYLPALAAGFVAWQVWPPSR